MLAATRTTRIRLTPLCLRAAGSGCRRLRRHAALVLLLLAALPAGAQPETPSSGSTPPPLEQRIARQVAPGVQHLQVIRREADRPLVMHALRADLRQPTWRLQVWPGKDVLLTPDVTKGREAVGNIAQRRGALAAINGDFFGSGDPLGLQITDGELLSEPYPGRCAFGITREGETLWGAVRFEATVSVGERSIRVAGINRPRGKDEVIVYTPRYGASTLTNAAGVEVVVEWPSGPVRAGLPVTGTVSDVRVGAGDTPIPSEGFVLSGHGAAAEALRQASTGDAVTLRINLAGEEGQNWNAAWQAVGGGPRLIRKGVVCVNGQQERFRADVLNGRNPRSAIAVTRDGELLLVAVDGRQPLLSGGMTLQELAEWLRAEGAVEAMNLDGGGSTTFALRNLVVNSPSQGTQRLVANALLVLINEQPPAEEGELALLPADGSTVADGVVRVAAGTQVRFRAVRQRPDGTLEDLPDDAVTWALAGQVGLLAQDGTLLGMRAGPGEVLCSTGRQVARMKVATVPGAPARVTAALEVAPDGNGFVRARVVDAYSNPVPGVELTLSYTTAEGPKTATGTTFAGGEGRVALPLTELVAGAPVTIATGGAPPCPVTVPQRDKAPQQGK